MRIEAVLDPLSTAAQKVLPILLALRDQFDVAVTVYLNPLLEVSEFPLKVRKPHVLLGGFMSCAHVLCLMLCVALLPLCGAARSHLR
jgi:hypothetical protein